MLLPIMDLMIEGPIPTKKSPARYENFVYLLKNDKILKLAITLDKRIIKENIMRLIDNLEDDKFEIVDEETMNIYDFVTEMEFVGKYKLNKKRKTNNYRIPDRGSFETYLIYFLNSIYNKTSLKSDDLYVINDKRQYYIDEPKEKVSKVWLSVIEDVVSNLRIEVIDEYEYTKLSESLDYIEQVRNRESLWSVINLKKLKNILVEAQDNIYVFENLNLYNENEFIYLIKTQKQKVK